jgi:chaperonin GroEL (HSP60 family)
MASANIIRVTQELEVLAGTCAGPNGSLKLLLQGSDLIVTTNSSRLMSYSHLLSTSPYAQVLFDLVRLQRAQFGDGGLFVLQFASGLVRRVHEAGLHHYHASSAFSAAMVRLCV